MKIQMNVIAFVGAACALISTSAAEASSNLPPIWAGPGNLLNSVPDAFAAVAIEDDYQGGNPLYGSPPELLTIPGVGAADAVGSPFPYVSASATGSYPGPIYYAAAGADLTYYAAVRGPGVIGGVPLVFTGIATTFENGIGAASGISSSYLTAADDGDGYLSSLQVLGSCSTFPVVSSGCGSYPGGTNKFRATLTIATNTLITVQLYANANGGGLPGGSASGSAYIDPYIQIDPTWLAANPGYVLDISNGIGNAALSGVPEPATWIMMFLGLGGLGGVMRARRQADRDVVALMG